MKSITSLVFLSSIFCSSEPAKNILLESALSSDLFTSINSFLNESDQNAFNYLSSKHLSRSFIIDALETSRHTFSRAQSLQIVRSADMIRRIVEKYGNLSIYPITLTFHPNDLPLLESLDVFTFIRRVQTVVFEGDQIDRLVIEAKHLALGAEDGTVESEWHDGIYNTNYWAWIQPMFLMVCFRTQSRQ